MTVTTCTPLPASALRYAGQRGDQRLALAGAHFGDLAVVQRHAADQLHVEVAHLQRPLAGLADDGERLGQERVERLAVGDALLELGGLRLQRLVGERGDRGLERVDLPDGLRVLLQQALVAAAEDAGEDVGDHGGFQFAAGGRKKQGVRTASPLVAVATTGASRRRSARGLQEPRGILRHAVQPDLEMQVRAGRTAGRSHRGDPLAAHDEVAFLDQQPATRARSARPARCRDRSR